MVGTFHGRGYQHLARTELGELGIVKAIEPARPRLFCFRVPRLTNVDLTTSISKCAISGGVSGSAEAIAVTVLLL